MTALTEVDSASTRTAAQRILSEVFAQAGIDTAALDARVLLCAALKVDHAGLVRDPGLPLGDAATALLAFAQRRMMHEPVSRIVGHREFFGETYRVDPSVLDPRADTETLVEAVLSLVGHRKNQPLRILDLGTGSGAILGALLGRLPLATGFGVDLSPAACRRAHDNLGALGLADRTFILAGSWFAPLKGDFDMIVSNPPYIASDQIEGLDPDVRCYDPHLALDGGADGFDAYRAIVSAAATYLAPDGLLALEFGISQLVELKTLLTITGFRTIEVRNDLAGRERTIVATIGART